MSHVDALQMVEDVRDRLVELAVSKNYVRDPAVADVFRRVWAEGGSSDGLVSELWVEGTLPGEKSPETLTTLAERGAFPQDLCSHIRSRGAFPTAAPLYTHQVEALQAATHTSARRPTLAITAGTGQGKTEAFLLPMLRDLWTAPAVRVKGMRALILYPLNALVSDQVERIYGWLKGQHKLTVFHFTSETPEDKRRADHLGELEWEPCRMRTRDEARGRESRDGRAIPVERRAPVPDVVITNYSMLEYMLCRPQDDCFFGPDLRCIVLDEAHLYTGALAAEIAMLLRRVRQRCGVSSENVLQIATSATLGGTDEELRRFASVLFSADAARTSVLRGRPGAPDIGLVESPPDTEPDVAALAGSSGIELTTLTSGGDLVEDASAETMQALRSIVSQLVARDVVEQSAAAHPACPARFLYRTLREAPCVHRLAERLLVGGKRVLNVDTLAGLLFPREALPTARRAAVLLLRLAAAASVLSLTLLYIWPSCAGFGLRRLST
jgi:ATP-dependent helicase YprA (DUF1998 family)